MTEIVKREGDEHVECVDSTHQANLSGSTLNIYGKTTNVKQTDMIRNTEYTKDSVGYTYLPGRDIFNNHILRNKSYRIVNRPPNQLSYDRTIFNTINDKMRASNGSYIQRCCRRELTDTSMQTKHLYDHDDILSFSNGDAVYENLRENDGWFGFYNNSVIPSKYNGKDMDISCVLNNRNKCEFIDMYPDRTLFSLVPKYNKYRNRLEYNWNYTLTYPFENTTTFDIQTQQGVVTKDFSVVAEGTVNALVIVDAKYVILPNGVNALLFRSAVKHNLKIGDKFVLFFNDDDGNGVWHEVSHASIVNGLGDMDNNYHDFYFYTTDDSVLEEIFAPESDTHTKWEYIRDYFYKPYDTSTVPNVDNDRIYNPGNLVNDNGVVYICTSTVKGFNTTNFIPFDDYQFTEYSTTGVMDIPSENDGYVKVNGTIYELYNHDIGIWYHDSGYDANRFIRNIVNNAFRNDDNPVTQVTDDPNSLYRDYIQFRFAKTNGTYRSQYYVRKFKKLPNIKYGTDQNEPLVDTEFDSEYYKLAFSNTIYGDEIAQAVFFDSVTTNGIRDNLGRPLTDIYLSIFKTNNGYREWYCGDGDGKGDAAVEYSHCFGPLTCGFDIFGLCSDTESMKDKRLSLVDVHMICNRHNDGERTLGDRDDISVDDDWYYGDIAEFCPWECTETVLSDVCFRFNTAQRELDVLDSSSLDNYKFFFDEIISDDYDYDGFVTEEYEIEDGAAVAKKEGYFYKPHKKIQLKGFGSLNQASHRNILVGHAEPIQMDGLYIKVSCLSNHGIYGSHRVRFRDKNNSANEIWLNVVSVIDKMTFVMEKIPHGADGYMDWIAMCGALNNGTYVLESENTDIPDYAYRISDNTYLWRRPTSAWDIDNETEGLSEYPFANGCLYIDNVYNLFVRRQDPYGCNRLYDGEPKTAVTIGTASLETESVCDIVSPLPEEPVEIYKDDSLAIC